MSALDDAKSARAAEELADWARGLGLEHVSGQDAQHAADVFPESPNIDFGKFVRRVPAIVVRPRNQDELACVLRELAARAVPMTVRAAAHSSGGQTLSAGGAVIDVRHLERVLHDDLAGERIRVEAGAWWLALCRHLEPAGRRPVVVTDNWRASVGGTIAVGGFGDATHVHGLQIATVTRLVVMTLDGCRHDVGPGEPLFHWSLAGRGQLGVITEVELATATRSYQLRARVLEWSSLESYVGDGVRICRERRFDWMHARVLWGGRPGAPMVAGAAGHTGAENRAHEFRGLAAAARASEELDLFAYGQAPPDERWELASPGVELALPVSADGLALLREIHRRVGGFPHTARDLPRGSSIMVLAGRDDRSFPMAPLPASEYAVLIAIRPETQRERVADWLAFLESLAELAITRAGRLYAMSIEPTRRLASGTPGKDAHWLAVELGPRYAELLALKAAWDPESLLNPGFIDVRDLKALATSADEAHA